MSAHRTRRTLLNTTVLIGAVALSLAAAGAQAQSRTYDIPAEPLSKALRDFGRASGRQIIFTEDLVRGRTSPALHGAYSPEEALARLLDGAGLTAETRPSGALMIVKETGDPQPQGGRRESATSVEEVVVTANKREEKLHDVAMGATALTGRDLDTRQELDIQDFAAQVPGFQIQQVTAGWNREILRGQNSGGAGATVSTVIDDFPLSFSGSENNGGLISTNLDTFDLQRIEVLKGPQGDLYGAAAESGIVKYVTNAPNLSQYQGGVEAGALNVEHGQTAASLKAFVNIPLVDDKLAVRITGYDEGVPGYINNPLMDRQAINSGYKYGGRISLLAKPTDDLSIKLTAYNQTIHANDASDVEVVGAAVDPSAEPAGELNIAHGWNFNTFRAAPTDNRIDLYGADIEYDLHWAKFSSLTSYGNLKNNFISDVSDDVVAVLSVAPPEVLTYQEYLSSVLGYYPSNFALIQRQTESVAKYNQEFRLSSETGNTLFDHPFEWQFGAFATREATTFDQLYDAVGQTGPLTPYAPPVGGVISPSQYEEAAVYGQVDYHFTPKFDIALGSRFTHSTEWSQVNEICCLLNGPGAVLPQIRSNEDAVTWSVSPRYKVDDNTLIYARISTGHRPGGPNITFPGAPPDYPLSYHSDSTRNYELGVRTSLFDKHVTVDAGVFDIDWTSIQIVENFVSAVTGGHYNEVGNGGTATSKGFEYNLGWTPLEGLQFGLVGSYTDSYLTSDAPAIGGFTGQRLAYVPLWRNTINVDYERPAFADYRAYIGGSYVMNAKVYTDFGGPQSHRLLPGYNTLDLHAGLRNDRYFVQVYGQNLTDAKGILNYSYSGGYNGTGFADFITPRSIGVRIGATY